MRTAVNSINTVGKAIGGLIEAVIILQSQLNLGAVYLLLDVNRPAVVAESVW